MPNPKIDSHDMRPGTVFKEGMEFQELLSGFKDVDFAFFHKVVEKMPNVLRATVETQEANFSRFVQLGMKYNQQEIVRTISETYEKIMNILQPKQDKTVGDEGDKIPF